MTNANAAWAAAQTTASNTFQTAQQAATSAWNNAEANARAAYDTAAANALTAWQTTQSNARATYQTSVAAAASVWEAAESSAWTTCQADIDAALVRWQATEATAYAVMEAAVDAAIAAWTATETSALAVLEAALTTALTAAQNAEAIAFANLHAALALAEVNAESAEASARATLQAALAGGSSSGSAAAAWGSSGASNSSNQPTPWDAFWGSLGDSYESMYTSIGAGMLDARNAFTDEDVPTQEMYERAYDLGPLGQTRDAEADPVGYYGTRGALTVATAATAAATYLLAAEMAAQAGLYNITVHGGQQMAGRAIPNAAVQWRLQVGTRQAALQSSRGMLANVVNFLTKTKHIAPAAQNMVATAY